MNYKFIELEVKDHIATVTLAREKSLNAVSLELASEITDVFRKLSAMDDVRVVILKSRARIFCAGLDLKDAAGGFTGTTRAPWDMIKKSQPLFDCCNVIEECPKPVIAAVHGQCIGAGLHIISACDIRLCTQDATFCLKEPKIGLCADMGALQRLPLIVGQGYAREIAFTVAFYNAQQVEKMGLVNHVYADQAALYEAAREMARQITENAPLAIECTKEVLNFSRGTSVSEGMSLAIQKNMFLLATDDLKEAFVAFMEKRQPDFKGR
ncbi:MAG TPA: enoyl-CoA hydratase-related protein [Smithella sp.]|jgi:enoyl-CoA hydratase|nr:enoyl-CoA hydratase/isomerase family protein [Smithella sp.]NMC96243.1 enoyl-CoA hydratase [Deltaproteobacteria bacterium]OQC53221.1 MAG: Carnitinyl-CoA dehydratase [Deltaproteobacteria bacterium ADurb.Bin022]HOO35455.1 enoyl-CoA hydratase-related protein [Smithella sp.]HPC07621.1 enoyl-CoA hydratase-related protein [Smithella sp.]